MAISVLIFKRQNVPFVVVLLFCSARVRPMCPDSNRNMVTRHTWMPPLSAQTETGRQLNPSHTIQFMKTFILVARISSWKQFHRIIHPFGNALSTDTVSLALLNISTQHLFQNCALCNVWFAFKLTWVTSAEMFISYFTTKNWNLPCGFLLVMSWVWFIEVAPFFRNLCLRFSWGDFETMFNKYILCLLFPHAERFNYCHYSTFFLTVMQFLNEFIKPPDKRRTE